MKPTHLKTLSARIDELDEFCIKGKITDYRFRELVHRANVNSKTPLTLSQFVPCDENGKPLEKPSNHEKWLEYKKQGFELHFGNEAHNSQYHKAQQNVIFEGWEVVSGKVIEHKETGCRVAFYSNGNVYFDRYTCSVSKGYLNYFLGTNPTLSDLAAATIENPLKLK